MHKRINYILIIIIAFFGSISFGYSQEEGKSVETISINELEEKKKSTTTDSLKRKVIEDYVTHKSANNMKIDVLKNTITLYDQAQVTYQQYDIQAGIIIIDNKTNIITAKGIIDSTGYIQRPIVKDGQRETELDSIIMSSKSKRTLAYNAKTNEGQDIVAISEVVKKENDSTLFSKNIKVTTSKKDNPDWYILIKKAMVRPGKKIVAGPSQLVIADVPTPAVLPFGYYPLADGQSSGVLIPTFGETTQQGYFLQDFGYYFAISDYIDLAVTSDVYSNGSWGIRANSMYSKRYRYSGSFRFSYENLVNSLRGFDDYTKATNYNITWSHTQAKQASPNTTFSASVNFGSSQFYRQSNNLFNVGNDYARNNLSSSISYYKKFVGTPFSITTAISHQQNTNTETHTMTLPNLNLAMDRLYPFASKDGVKKNAFQKIGLNYSMNATNTIAATDTTFLKKGMFDNMRSGMKHDLSLATNMKVLKYFSLSPSVNYQEVWYPERVTKRYDEVTNEVVTDTISGFTSYRTYRGSVSLSTQLYGTYTMKKQGKLKGFRHVMTPSVSYGYTPSFDQYWEEVQQSEDENDLLDYSRYEIGVYGSPTNNLSNSLSFSLGNTLDAKMSPKDSTSTEDRKIKILNTLNFSGSYNMAADSLKWSPMNMSGSTNLFKNKLALNFSGSFDPYAVNANGSRINTLNKDLGGSLFRFTRGSANMQFSFSSKDFDGTNKDNESNGGQPDSGEDFFGGNLNARTNLFDEGGTGRGEGEDNKVETTLYRSKIPWDLSFSYGLNYNNNGITDSQITNTLNFRGNIQFSPKWKVGFSSGYDFENKGFTPNTNFSFQRDLDSWRMSLSYIPLGFRKQSSFFIGVKSATFSDLKYEKDTKPDKALF